MGPDKVHRPNLAVGIAGIAFALTVAYSIAGSLQVLVWNPKAAVPGATLEEIAAAMARANETLAVPLVVTWAVTGILLAAGVFVAALAMQLPAGAAAKLGLAIVALGAPSHWFASFPAGMGIADTFATSGGDHAPWGMLLYAVSVVAFAALLVLVVRRRNGIKPIPA
ncbi:hypothetical protein [Arthrobacter sp. HY1533]|uniref:hypothetical protein n=1 Tax=Arthrobacter sp. HY1533 TaxID=2970919 RepID=UPI0022B9DEC9|nr:hypothetical protein [Arthrobacter sp. HY1533]